jgi:hypothetical protein
MQGRSERDDHLRVWVRGEGFHSFLAFDSADWFNDFVFCFFYSCEVPENRKGESLLHTRNHAIKCNALSTR